MAIKYLSSKDIAKKYGVSMKTITNWVNSGLPYKIKKEIGKKPYRVFDIEKTELFLRVGTHTKNISKPISERKKWIEYESRKLKLIKMGVNEKEYTKKIGEILDELEL